MRIENTRTKARAPFLKHTVTPVEELGDFTTTWRVLPISGLAIVIGVVSAYVALFLLRLIGGLGNLGIYRTLRQAFIAVIVMGLVVGVAAVILPSGVNLMSKLLAVALPVSAGVLVYLIMLSVLGVTELNALWQRVLRRPSP